MPAQSGSAILLNVGPQGSRQAGGSITLNYSTPPRVRVTGGAVLARWGASRPESAALRATMPATAPLDRARRASWVYRGQAVQPAATVRWGVGIKADRARTAAWAYRGMVLQPAVRVPWGQAQQAEREVRAPWGQYGPAPLTEWVAPWGIGAPADRGRRVPWGASVAVLGVDTHAPSPASRGVGIVQWVPWGRFSRPLSPGWGIVVPPGPTPDPSGTWIVPTQTVYVVINETSLVRVSDNALIPTTSMSLSLDADSWTWGFNASVPMSAYDLVADLTEVQAAVNGVLIRLVVESISRERTFGNDWLRISGRGRAAELGAPYSPVMTYTNPSARTAQQLANDALLDNGVPLPWDVEWNLTDWLVPAGALSMQGARMDAIRAIAAAAGGYVQPHNTLQVVRILHRYPVAPWDWGTMTPDYELPAAVVQREGIEWVTKASYNRVFVSGTTADGVLGQVSRAGTAGDVVAPMVTDPLITHADAARQRGTTILADTGNQALVTLRLPVLEETGVIVPGNTVRYVDGATTRIGIVRATSVDVGYPEVWQTLKVETHP